MDYSKLTTEQLMKLLESNAPSMYSNLIYSDNETVPASPYDYPEIFNSLAKGYDPGLMEQEYLNLKNNLNSNTFLDISPMDSLNNNYNVLGEQNPYDTSVDFENMYGNPLGGGGIYSAFPSDLPDHSFEGTAARNSANFFNQFTDEQLLNSLRPVSNVDPMELLDDYESGTDSVDRILKRNKNFRWD